MKEIIGCFDGNTVQLPEDVPAIKQKVKVTFIDEDEAVFDDLPMGALSQYADAVKRNLEEGAFERAIVAKDGNG